MTLTTTTAGSISLQADNAATIDARVKGQTTATSELPVPPALSLGAAVAFNAIGWDAFNVLLASNKVSSAAQAYIDDTDPDAGRTVRAGAGLTIAAHDDASIESDSNVVSSAVTSNTLDGLKEIAKTLGRNDYQLIGGQDTKW